MCLHMPYSTPATVSPHVAPLCPLPRTRQVSPTAACRGCSVLIKDSREHSGYICSVSTDFCGASCLLKWLASMGIHFDRKIMTFQNRSVNINSMKHTDREFIFMMSCGVC